jgi:hypothetical protein
MNDIYKHFTDISNKARKYIEGLDSDEVTDAEDFDNFNDLVKACVMYSNFLMNNFYKNRQSSIEFVYDKFTDIDK